MRSALFKEDQLEKIVHCMSSYRARSSFLVSRAVVSHSTVLRANMSGFQPPKYASRLKGFDGPTVWQEFTPLAQQYKADNLGQGFPDWETPQFVKDSMNHAVAANFNQYCR